MNKRYARAAFIIIGSFFCFADIFIAFAADTDDDPLSLPSDFKEEVNIFNGGIYCQEGINYFNGGDYNKALDSFLKQLDLTPFDSVSREMIKKVGDIFLQRKKEAYMAQIEKSVEQLDYLSAAEAAMGIMKLDPDDKNTQEMFSGYLRKYESAKMDSFKNERKRTSELYKNARIDFDEKRYFTARRKLMAIKENPYSTWRIRWKANSNLEHIQKYIDDVLSGDLSVTMKDLHYVRAITYYMASELGNTVGELEKSFAADKMNKEIPGLLEELRPKVLGKIKEKEEKSKLQGFLDTAARLFQQKKYKEAVGNWKDALEMGTVGEQRVLIQDNIKNAEKLIVWELEEERKRIAERNRQAAADEERRAQAAASSQSQAAPAQTQSAQPAQTVKPSEPLVKLSPAESRKLYNEGLQAYAIGNLEKAISLWQSVVASDPENTRAKANLARAERELKNR